MGGGNGQKSMMARQKNLEKQKAVKGSQLDTNKKAMNIQFFDASAENKQFESLVAVQGVHADIHVYHNRGEMQEHAEAMHPKSNIFTCFPQLKK